MENILLIAGDPGYVRGNLASILGKGGENRVFCVELLTRHRHHPVASLCREAADPSVFQLEFDDAAGIASLVAELNPRTIINLFNSADCENPHASAKGQAPSVTVTRNLLDAARHAWLSRSSQGLVDQGRRYLQVSTVLPVDAEFSTLCRKSQTSDLSRRGASQPSDTMISQRLAQQWSQYYGLPTINVSVPNIFGPDQSRDQFFPAIIETLLQQKPLRLSQSRRDWAFVEDIVDAVIYVAKHGSAGEHYRVRCDKGGRTDIAMAELICDQLDQLTPCASGSYRDYIQAVRSASVSDYDGPEMRELGPSLGWRELNDFHCSLAATVRHYIK